MPQKGANALGSTSSGNVDLVFIQNVLEKREWAEQDSYSTKTLMSDICRRHYVDNEITRSREELVKIRPTLLRIAQKRNQKLFKKKQNTYDGKAGKAGKQNQALSINLE